MIKQFIKNRLRIAQRNIISEWEWLKEYGICSFIILLLGSSITAILIFACFYGIWIVVTENKDILSATGSIGLSLLAAALGGVLLLVMKPRPDSENGLSGQISQMRRQTSGRFGYSLIVAAMAFALFGLLAPFLSITSNGQRFFPNTPLGDFSEFITKWVALISFITGTVTLVIPLTFGPFVFLADFLSQRRKTRKLKKDNTLKST